MSDNLQLLEAYLSHHVSGLPYRELARQTGLQPSTHMRRTKRCDEMTDHSDWEDLVQRLADYRNENQPENLSVSPEDVMEGLGIDKDAVTRVLLQLSPVLSVQSSTILAGDMKMCAAIAEHLAKESFPKEFLLFFFAMGWVGPKEGTAIDGKVRIFVPLEGLVGAASEFVIEGSLKQVLPRQKTVRMSRNAAHLTQVMPIELLCRRNSKVYNQAVQDQAFSFRQAWMFRETTGKDVWLALHEHVPPRTMRFLELVCGEGIGLEVVEKKLEMSARSAKMVLLHALDFYQMAHDRIHRSRQKEN